MPVSSLALRIALSLAALAICLLLWQGYAATEAEDSSQEVVFRLLMSKSKCQLAIWLTDEEGAFIDTVYVTKKTAQKGLGNRGGKLDGKLGGSRLSNLPVWAYSRGFDYGGGNFYPPKGNPLPDAITSATPKEGEFVWTWRPQKRLEPGRYVYYIEVNKSFDKNEHHKYSWYRGQPSVIWKGDLRVGDEVSESAALIIGHGHVAGADGRVHPDVSNLTTAIRLIGSVEVIYRP
jgi:hypothetical protein